MPREERPDTKRRVRETSEIVDRQRETERSNAPHNARMSASGIQTVLHQAEEKERQLVTDISSFASLSVFSFLNLFLSFSYAMIG